MAMIRSASMSVSMRASPLSLANGVTNVRATPIEPSRRATFVATSMFGSRFSQQASPTYTRRPRISRA
ncbi:MAG TPA: hypothetical protein VF713_27360 [Thermoanaerobaculia bacterium]